MLKFGAWLSDSRRWDGDLTLRYETDSLKIVVLESPVDGTYAHYQYEYRQTDGEKGAFDYEVINSSEETGMYSVPQERTYRAFKSRYIPGACFGFRFTEEPESKPLGNYNFGFFCTPPGEDTSPTPAFNLQLRIPPAFYVALLHEYAPKTSVKDGMLSFTDGWGCCWIIEAASGRLQSITFDTITPNNSAKRKTSEKEAVEEKSTTDPSNLTLADAKAGDEKIMQDDDSDAPWKIEIRFVKGAFKEAAEKIHRESEKYVNEYESERCIASLAAFFCNEPYYADYLKKNNYNDKWLQIAQRFLAFGVLDPLDQMINESQNVNNNFVIPCEPGWMNSGWNITNPSYWAMLALSINDDLFPVSSWPWTLIQQIGFISINKMEHVSGEGSRLYNSPDTGPLSFLATATLLDYWNSPATKTIAQRGLDRLDKKAFLADCKPFLSKNHQVGKCLRKAVDAYRFFTNEEVRALAEKLDGKNLKYLALCDQILRSDPARDFDDVMPELLGSLWDAGLKDQIELSLIHLLNNKK
jgi:hypothetical protein